MREQRFDIVIKAVTRGAGDVKKFSNEFVRAGKRIRLAGKAFNDTFRGGRRVISGLAGELKGLVGAYAGFEALRFIKNTLEQSDQAVFNLTSSVAAANREFENIGTVEEWGQTVKALFKELKIYGETELQNAVSRTVDMTKRLGMSKLQMEEVIRRSADLGAGKTDLTGAIERVTAALRGEAEASEYLGLTLNETYVKSWHEANNATGKAWKNLTDLEKAQVRYLVFLEQSHEFQGRAAASSKTLGNSLKIIGWALQESIVNNEEYDRVTAELSQTLRNNSDEIVRIFNALVTASAKLVQFVVHNRNAIATVAKWAGSLWVLGKFYRLVLGISAAFKTLTGMGIVAWLASVRIGMAKAAAAAGAAGVAARAFPAMAAAYGVYQIYETVKAFLDMREAQETVRKSQERMIATSDRALKSLSKFKDVELPKDLNALSPEQLKKTRWELERAKNYYTVLKRKLEIPAKETNIFGFATEKAKEAWKEIEAVDDRLTKITADIKKTDAALGSAAKGMAKPKEAVAASVDELEKFEKKVVQAYDTARQKAKQYADEVIAWEEKIKYARMSTADKLRELGRKGMTDYQAWTDRKKEAEEKLSAARKALYEKDYAAAEKLAQDAESLFEGLAAEVKSTRRGEDVVTVSLRKGIDAAKQGVTETGNLLTEIYGAQKETAAKSQKEWEVAAKNIEQQLAILTRAREAKVKIALEDLEKAKNQLDSWLKKPSVKIVTIKTVEAKASGGPVGLSRGAFLSGYGGGDRIHALLEAGEFVIRKEAVKKYGAALFAALNQARVNLPGLLRGTVKARLGGMIANLSMPRLSLPAFASGGSVPNMGVKDMGRVEIGIAGKAFPVMAKADVIGELKAALLKEKLLRSNDGE